MFLEAPPQVWQTEPRGKIVHTCPWWQDSGRKGNPHLWSCLLCVRHCDGDFLSCYSRGEAELGTGVFPYESDTELAKLDFKETPNARTRSLVVKFVCGVVQASEVRDGASFLRHCSLSLGLYVPLVGQGPW